MPALPTSLGSREQEALGKGQRQALVGGCLAEPGWHGVGEV